MATALCCLYVAHAMFSMCGLHDHSLYRHECVLCIAVQLNEYIIHAMQLALHHLSCFYNFLVYRMASIVMVLELVSTLYIC